MDRRPIGVFDSGIGGLTVASALLSRLPAESIVYFGDEARTPYGAKSAETILRYAEENTRFLLGHGVKAVIVACNTATAVALPMLRERFDVPVIGVIEPGAARAVEVSPAGKIGVIGTVRTVTSGAYARAIRELSPDADVTAAACPLFVPLIEEGWAEHEVTRLVAREYLDPLVAAGIDTLVLGCTHYPLLAAVLAEAYPALQLVDSAVSTAERAAALFAARGLLADAGAPGGIEIYLSDYSEAFRRLAETILRRPVEAHLHRVGLEELTRGA